MTETQAPGWHLPTWGAPVATPVGPPPAEHALQAFIDSHATTRRAHYQNWNGAWTADESVPCECALCHAGRAALSGKKA